MESVRIDVPADDDGYFSFECPRCGDRFKLQTGEFAEHDPSPVYCPLCGLNAERREFLTEALHKVAEQHVENIAAEFLHKIFKDFERKTRGSKNVRFEAGPAPKKVQVPELREVTDLAIVKLSCCDLTVKVPHSDGISVVYCPYCGMEQG
jgi:uncharacterized C2H2 Zn-finger protein